MREPLLFFNEAAAETIEAATARVFPSDELGVGAIEARVVIYIDRALAGPYASLGDLYRRAIAGSPPWNRVNWQTRESRQDSCRSW
jgi:hypothetical protein